MDSRIRVLEMIDDAAIGGGQIHVLLLAEYLDRNIFDVEVACEGKGYLADELRKRSIPVVPLKMGNTVRPRTLRETVAVLRRGNYDILHTHGGTSGFWGRIASLYSHTPRVRIHTYHGIHYVHRKGAASRLFCAAERLLVRATDRIITVCPSDKEKALRLKLTSPAKTTVVYNGIEIERYSGSGGRSEVRQQLNIPADTFIFGTVGRLNIQKGHIYLIKAFAELHRDHPNSELWIVGSGELHDDLQLLAHECGIEKSVRFLGDRDNIPEILAALDAFIISSLWEGMPLALLEAMASGKPVVATGVDGITDLIVHGENGILVPVREVARLTESMVQIFKDKSLRGRLAENARQTVTARYTAQATAGMIGQIYLEEWGKRGGIRNF